MALRAVSQRSAAANTYGVAGRQNEQVGREGLVSIWSGNRQSGTSSAFSIQLPGLLKNVPDGSLKPARVLMVSSLYDIPVGYETFYYREANSASVVTLTQGSVAAGCYSGPEFAAAVQASLVATSPNAWPYTVTFTAATGKITVRTNGPAGSRWGFGSDANSYKMSNCFGMDSTGSGVAGCAEVVEGTRVVQLNPVLVHIMTDLATNGYASHARGPANLLATVALLAAPFSLNEIEIVQAPNIIMANWPGSANFYIHRMDLDPVNGTRADLNGTEWAIELVSSLGSAY